MQSEQVSTNWRTDARSEYKRQRAIGNTAKQSLRNARIAERFATLEASGVVRLAVAPDGSPALSYLDQRDCFPEHIAKREYKRANDDGVWGLIGEFRLSESDAWQSADSVWGFISDDWQDSGYDFDIASAAIEAYEKATCDNVASL